MKNNELLSGILGKSPKVESPEGGENIVAPAKPIVNEEEQPVVEANPVKPIEEGEVASRMKQFLESVGVQDEDSFFNGDYASRIKNYDNITKKVETLETENGALYDKYKDVNNPYANESVFKINKLLKDNPEMSLAVASKLVNSGETKSLDSLILKERIDNPDLSEGQVKKLLQRKYNVEDWSEVDEDAQELIDIDAIRAKRELSKLTEGLAMPEDLTPESIRESLAAKNVQATESIEQVEAEWKPVMEQFDTRYDEIPIPIPSEDGVGVYTKFMVDPTERGIIRDNIMAQIRQSKAKVSKETIAAVDNMVTGEIMMKNLPKIVKIIVDKAKSDAAEEISKGKYNPSTPQGKTAAGKTASGQKDLISIIKNGKRK